MVSAARRSSPIRRAPFVAAVLASAAVLIVAPGCSDDTVRIAFDPEIGDVYRFRSSFESSVTRRLDAEEVTDGRTDVLDATEEVVDVGDTVVVDVTVRRGAERVRRFEARFDRADRLTTIDLVDGVPVAALGVDVDSGLPASVTSPPDRPLRVGETWAIDEDLTDERGLSVTGEGRLVELGVIDGSDVAVVEVDLVVDVARAVDTANGTVSLDGTETVSVRTVYDLDDGLARTDHTEVSGDVDVLVAPPPGIASAPVEGALRYRVRGVTERVEE